MNRLKLGVVLEPLGLPPRQALHAAARLGAAGVQIDAAGDLAPDRLGDTARREFRTLLRGANLELAALNCPLRRGLDSAENQHQRIDHVRKVMQFAVDLGTRVVVTPLPRVPTEPDSPRAVLLREALADLGGFGDRIGVQLALEPGLDAGDNVRDYLAGFDSGGLAVTFDPANHLLNGFDPLSSLAALGQRVVYTQARDGRAATVSGAGKELPVGAGDIEWMAYVATLESVGYRGFLCVDMETGGTRAVDVASGVNFLRRFVPA